MKFSDLSNYDFVTDYTVIKAHVWEGTGYILHQGTFDRFLSLYWSFNIMQLIYDPSADVLIIYIIKHGI